MKRRGHGRQRPRIPRSAPGDRYWVVRRIQASGRFQTYTTRPLRAIDIEDRIAAATAGGGPTLDLVMPLPLLSDPDPSLLAAFYSALAEATEPVGAATSARSRSRAEHESDDKPGLGRPRRNAYLAAEAAYFHDIELRPEFTSPTRYRWFRDGPPEHVPCGAPDLTARDFNWRSMRRATQRSYLNPSLRLQWDNSLDRFRSRGVRRWREEGRRVLAALCVWPWAVASAGQVAPTKWDAVPWHEDRRYWDVLDDWARRHHEATPPR